MRILIYTNHIVQADRDTHLPIIIAHTMLTKTMTTQSQFIHMMHLSYVHSATKWW